MGYLFGCDLDIRTGTAYMPVAEPIPYPVAPAPEAERPTRAQSDRKGGPNEALHASWGEYCGLAGLDAKKDRQTLRDWASDVLRVELRGARVASISTLSDEQRSKVGRAINDRIWAIQEARRAAA